MYTRVLTFTGAKNIDDGIVFIREKALPVVREQKGYGGINVSADRSGGVLGILSLWETEADRDASLNALAKTRDEGLAIVGGALQVEAFEQLLAEVSKPPPVGSALMITRISMDPAKIDENLAYFKRERLPLFKARPGFLALRSLMNRQTGQGAMGSAWTDEATMKAWAAEAPTLRQEAVARGVNFGEQSFREIVFSDLR
jgi:heme-degrading monooxygenase HmoA